MARTDPIFSGPIDPCFAPVSRLLSLRLGPERERILTKALAGRWTYQKLGIEIRRLYPNRRALAGRPGRTPESVSEAMVMMQRLGTQFEAFCAMLDKPGSQGNSRGQGLPVKVTSQRSTPYALFFQPSAKRLEIKGQ